MIHIEDILKFHLAITMRKLSCEPRCGPRRCNKPLAERPHRKRSARAASRAQRSSDYGISEHVPTLVS